MIKLQQLDGEILLLKEDVNFWWVNQGQTFQKESGMGIIGCRNDANGKYHKSLCNTKKDDLIIHYSKGKILAISKIIKACYVEGSRRKNDCKYYFLVNPINKTEIVENINPLPNPPFNSIGNIQQSYLFPIKKNFFKSIFKNVILVSH